ncbi:MAG: hypothetical protein A3F71_16870 [Burkholderiales bacterium RIFCSPLOWO2_12_FULL_64_33]|nr:MAG: hypothetical protein A3C40_01255 [Burkholderiales bacterium RIFCSPHIGHO2_02_FULL_64_19]OGB57453.1 MAG: hypothetical protein A3F71_16870 [Burkholderiales bacterium RIFCSPLOWO2_12_FULL_64_33]
MEVAALPARVAVAVALGVQAQAEWARLGRIGKVEALAAQGVALGALLVMVARILTGAAVGMAGAGAMGAPQAQAHHRMAIPVQGLRQAVQVRALVAIPTAGVCRAANSLPGRSLAFWQRPSRWRAHL